MPDTVEELVEMIEPWEVGEPTPPLFDNFVADPVTIPSPSYAVVSVEEKEDPPIRENVKTVVKENKKTTLKEGAVSSPAWISPSQYDTLFWCLYCIHYGYNDYHQVSRNYGIKVLEVKQKIAKWIQENPGKLKQTNYKITKASVQEILSDCLTSQKETNMLSLLAFLSYFNMNILIMDSNEKLIMEFIGVVGMDNPTYLIKKDTYGKYKIKEEALTIVEIQEWKSKCLLLDSYEKPLKSISNYKVDDLEKLAKKLGVFDEGKKYKKADLYMTIFEACTFPVNIKSKQNYR